jgi:hypothetical protein
LILTRALAVLAAANVVAAFALATLMPPMMSLEQLVRMAGDGPLIAVQDFVVGRLSPWLWQHTALPLLTRPDWLLPACFGIVFAGGAMTLFSVKGAPRSHRRRS